MAITWNMDFASLAAADFQDKAFIQMFVAALLERGYDITSLGPFTKGFNLQDKTLWAEIESEYHATLSGWLRPDSDLTGVSTSGDTGYAPGPGNSNNLPEMTDTWFLDNCYNGTAFVLGGDGTFQSGLGYSAHYPKEFGTFTSVAEPNFANFKHGDFYRKLDDGLVYERIGTDFTDFDASGWQRSSHVVPTIRSFLGDPADVYKGAHSSLTPDVGDYVFSSFLNCLRDAINFLSVRGSPVTAPSGSPVWTANSVANHLMATGAGATWLLAETNAEANYALATADVSDAVPIAVYLGFNGYSASIERRQSQLSVPTPADGLTPDVVLYAFGAAPLSGFGTFDANGDTIGNRALAKFDTQSADGAGTTLLSVMVGGLAVPTRAGDPTAADTGTGYVISADLGTSGFLVAWKYNVAGGFTYQ